jgi:hypothetical protein
LMLQGEHSRGVRGGCKPPLFSDRSQSSGFRFKTGPPAKPVHRSRKRPNYP